MEITLEITQYCENNCNYCSSNASREGKHLPYRDIVSFLEEIQEPISRINISGGEPLAHPDFYFILRLCKSMTTNVWVYTNAIEKLIYNTDVIKEVEVHANVCLVPGKEIYLPKNAQKIHLLQLVCQGRAENMEPGNFSVSGNLKGTCNGCSHKLLQADGTVTSAPCAKKYN